MHSLLLATLLATTAMAGPALAKLPPPSEEAKAQTADAAQKAAWSGKVNAYKVCQIEDRLAKAYHERVKDAPPAQPSPACAEPGPAPIAARPIEASEAHSPPGNATAPPSTPATAAELTGTPKK